MSGRIAGADVVEVDERPSGRRRGAGNGARKPTATGRTRVIGKRESRHRSKSSRHPIQRHFNLRSVPWHRLIVSYQTSMILINHRGALRRRALAPLAWLSPRSGAARSRRPRRDQPSSSRLGIKPSFPQRPYGQPASSPEPFGILTTFGHMGGASRPERPQRGILGFVLPPDTDDDGGTYPAGSSTSASAPPRMPSSMAEVSHAEIMNLPPYERWLVSLPDDSPALLGFHGPRDRLPMPMLASAC